MEEYNGWTNRETWAAALWINNDPTMQEIAQEYADSDKYGESLSDWFNELWAEFAAGETSYAPMFSDIGSLWRVNWREIAESLLED